MVKSKTFIEKQIKRKTNPELVETVIAAKKNKAWLQVAGMLSGPRRKRLSINLDKLEGKEGETIVVPGKVLSQGEINKKTKIVALSFSKKAEEKLLNAKCEISSIINEIKKNPEANNIKILSSFVRPSVVERKKKESK